MAMSITKPRRAITRPEPHVDPDQLGPYCCSTKLDMMSISVRTEDCDRHCAGQD